MALRELPFVKLLLDTVVCNSAMKTCVKALYWEQAFMLLGFMTSSRFQLDPAALTIPFGAVGPDAEWNRAASLLGNLRKSGLQMDSVAGCVAVSALGKKQREQQWEQASVLVVGMQQHSVECNVLVCNAAAAVLDRNRKWREVLAFAKQFTAVHVSADGLTHISVLNSQGRRSWHQAISTLSALPWQVIDARSLPPVLDACATAREWQVSLMLLACMRRRRLRADACTHRAVVLSSSDHWNHALSTLQALMAQAGQQDTTVVAAAEGVLDERGAWAQSLSVYRCFADAPLGPTLETCSLALRACSKGSQWQLALRLLGEARNCQVQPDGVVFNTLMSALDEQWQKALKIFDSSESLRSNAVSCRVVISATGRADSWQVASKILRLFADTRLQTDSSSCTAAVDAVGSSQQWERANALIVQQQSRGVVMGVACRAKFKSVEEEVESWTCQCRPATMGLSLAARPCSKVLAKPPPIS